MNRLDPKDRAQILNLLCEGMAIRAVAHVTGKSKNTISKLLVDAGKVCSTYQNRHFHNLTTKRIEVGEIWSFVSAEKHSVTVGRQIPESPGDIYTWTAIDADCKLAISWLVGRRDGGYASSFIDDLKPRLANRVQLTSNGNRIYLVAANEGLDVEVGRAEIFKLSDNVPDAGEDRDHTAERTAIKKIEVEGVPDINKVSASYLEYQNLTMRMSARRFASLNNGLSKKIENFEASVALHFMFYNFVKINKTLKCTPAMAANITTKIWKMKDIVDMIEAEEANVSRRRGLN